MDVNFQNIFPEQLSKVGDGNDGEFEDRMPEHSFEEDEAKEGKSVAVLRRCERRRIGERIVAIFVVVACEERDGGRLHTHPA